MKTYVFKIVIEQDQFEEGVPLGTRRVPPSRVATLGVTAMKRPWPMRAKPLSCTSRI
jgi:hypothetical protein